MVYWHIGVPLFAHTPIFPNICLLPNSPITQCEQCDSGILFTSGYSMDSLVINSDQYYDLSLFTAFVEKVIVSGEKKAVLLTFVLRDGSKYPVEADT